MSTLLSVTFDSPYEFTDQKIREGFEGAIPDLQQIPGLVWKVWTPQPGEGRGASFYLFDTVENAKQWGEGPLRASLENLGNSNIEVQYWEVEEEFSKQTFATLQREQG
ncbi:YdhR family protein [Corynebacterium aquatimens]|uniref:YdhR family protein n=1 Tax=Corynebacterium aquatimens TaxID=1190508 RepID=UPI002541CE87|nr:YdhR family protein [Corynebacterium aquatimens]QYH19035.1 YdhR family protein [Corynebacterium aquatimens]